MAIDWVNFTPFSALGGGVLIGLSAGLMLLFIGKTAGISGILGSLLRGRDDDVAWRLMFLLGLVCAPFLWSFLVPQGIPAITQRVSGPLGWTFICLGGVLVGFGTRLANGCTSGHGVCGLARLSKRSLFAVVTFMSAGMLTVFMTRHVLGV